MIKVGSDFSGVGAFIQVLRRLGKQNRIYDADAISPVLDTECGRPKYKIGFKIRRLTPRECFRLMDFPDEFQWVCSDTQAYKQAGNSIVVAVLAAIIAKLRL